MIPIIPSEVRTMLVQHMGLGDAVICNALTRHFVRECEVPVGLFCAPPYEETIRFMFRDLGSKLVVIPVHNVGKAAQSVLWDGIWKAIDRFPGIVVNLTMFRENFNYYTKHGSRFDRCFYHFARVRIARKWEDFRCDYDPGIQEKISGRYVFLHDDPDHHEGKFEIDRTRVRGDLPILEPWHFQTTNVFSLVDVIENAEEVHCINSSFLNLVDFLNPKGKLYWHYYSRIWKGVSDPKLRLKWIKLE